MDFVMITSEITENNQLRGYGSPPSDGVGWQVIAFLRRSRRDLLIKKIIFIKLFCVEVAQLQAISKIFGFNGIYIEKHNICIKLLYFKITKIKTTLKQKYFVKN